jgi:hypothetical protein
LVDEVGSGVASGIVYDFGFSPVQCNTLRGVEGIDRDKVFDLCERKLELAQHLCMHSIAHARSPEKTSVRGRRVSRERPADQCVGVTVSHSVFGFEISDDRHLSIDAAVGDEVLPLRYRATILLLD